MHHHAWTEALVHRSTMQISCINVLVQVVVLAETVKCPLHLALHIYATMVDSVWLIFYYSHFAVVQVATPDHVAKFVLFLVFTIGVLCFNNLEKYLDNPCINAPCLNGGVCQINSFSNGYFCTCPSGYSGFNCQTCKKNFN